MSFGSKSLPAPTPEQLRRWALIRDKGCICCRMHGYMGGVEIHHLLSGGRRMGHDFTIGLCSYHHRGVGDGYGPSLMDGSKVFRREYGQDEHLLAWQNIQIGWTAPPVRERQRPERPTRRRSRDRRTTASTKTVPRNGRV